MGRVSHEGDGITLGALAALVIGLPQYAPPQAVGSLRDMRDGALPPRAAPAYAVPRDVAGVATYPALWVRESLCVHEHESRDWHIYNPPYAGGFQFTLATWNSAGRPYRSLRAVAQASPAEQSRRAYRVFLRAHTWRNDWPSTSRLCGTR